MSERNPFGDVVPADGIGKIRRDWFRSYYGQLTGAAIVGVRIDVQRWHAFPALVVRTKDGKRLLVRVRTTPAGKPGHLEIAPMAGEED